MMWLCVVKIPTRYLLTKLFLMSLLMLIMLTTNACVATCPIKFVTYKCNGKCNWCHYIVLHVEGPRVKCIDLLKALNSSVVIYHQSLSYLVLVICWCCWDLNDVTLSAEDTNSLFAYKANSDIFADVDHAFVRSLTFNPNFIEGWPWWQNWYILCALQICWWVEGLKKRIVWAPDQQLWKHRKSSEMGIFGVLGNFSRGEW